MFTRDGWSDYDEARIRESFASRDNDPLYPAAVAEARRHGYEPASLAALLTTGNEMDLYSWRGRVWVKIIETEPGGPVPAH